MNKLSYATQLALLAFALPVLTGCYKVIDYASHHPGGEVKICRIEKIVFNNDDNATATFSYNANNDPVSIRQDNTVLSLPLDYYFRYDAQHRVSDFMECYYHAPGAMIWHRYSYPDKRTIIDSQFNYVGLINDPEPPHSGLTSYVYKYTLDAWSRIIKSLDYFSSSVTSYVYDDRGNLVRPGVQYDNKVNIYRTSSAFMLIRKDYSANNPLPGTQAIDSYNTYYLPLHYTSLNGNTTNELFGYYYTGASVAYSCDIDWQSSK